MLAQVQGATLAPHLPDNDDYLTHTEDGTVFPGFVINATGYHSAEVRLRCSQATVWFAAEKAGFTSSVSMCPAEARRIGEALLKAAEDAEEFARQLQAEDDYQTDLAHSRDMEMDLVREAEERGEEYVPTAIGHEHMNFIEMAVLHGQALKPWQRELAPEVRVTLHHHDGGCIDLKPHKGCFNAWFRWHPSAHPQAHVLHVRHPPTNSSTNYTATTDDFGSLVIVPKLEACAS